MVTVTPLGPILITCPATRAVLTAALATIQRGEEVSQREGRRRSLTLTKIRMRKSFPIGYTGPAATRWTRMRWTIPPFLPLTLSSSPECVCLRPRKRSLGRAPRRRAVFRKAFLIPRHPVTSAVSADTDTLTVGPGTDVLNCPRCLLGLAITRTREWRLPSKVTYMYTYASVCLLNAEGK